MSEGIWIGVFISDSHFGKEVGQALLGLNKLLLASLILILECLFRAPVSVESHFEVPGVGSHFLFLPEYPFVAFGMDN